MQYNNRNKLSAAFLTLGCKVNYYETGKMVEQFQKKGFEIKDFSESADIYVVNTCTVTNIADRKSRQMLHRAKKRNPDSIVIAVGCYVDSAGQDILKDSAIDAAFSNSEKDKIAEQVIQAFHLSPQAGTDIVPQKGRTRAYLKIQDGCNQFCSYCLIPYVRGGGVLTDMPVVEVLRQAEELAAHGYKEIVLTGIHLSSYGVAQSEEKNFVRHGGKPLLDVICQVADIPGIERIRLGSLEPRIITEEFLLGLSGVDKLCPHFHLSLQSGCDKVLKRMNRHYTTVEYREKVDLLRRFFDYPAVTTDVIVGFPGETDEEFLATRKYLSEIRLADIHVFKYSPRAGTRAAGLDGQISPEIKNMRSDILLEDVKEYQREYRSYFLGREESVLFEETVTEDGVELLAGLNERHVKIGIPIEEAVKMGYKRNQIHTVTVKKILF